MSAFWISGLFRIGSIRTPFYLWKWNDNSITRRNIDEDFTFATYDHVIRQRIALTEEFISKLKPDEQETANALNRRTEFKVLRTTYNMFDENGNLKNIPKPRKPKVEEEPASEDEFYFDF